MPVNNLFLSKGEKCRKVLASFLYVCDILKLDPYWKILVSCILKGSSKYVYLQILRIFPNCDSYFLNLKEM